MSVQQVKEISIYDTIHDFRSLGDNEYYTRYIQQELANLYITNKLAASHVEDALTVKFELSMEAKKDFVDYAVQNSRASTKYFTRVDDFDNEVFKTWMGTIILMNTNKIDFVTDTTLMSYRTGCSIRVNTHNQQKNGRFITNSSTIYDRGNSIAAADNTCVFMLTNDEVQITKEQGHLFEIDYIKVNNNTVKYKIPTESKEVTIDLSEYIQRDSDSKQFKLPLYQAVISYLRDRKQSALYNLLKLLEDRYNIPKDFMDRVRNRDEYTRISLSRMLFDFKRAGDHLQVKSCAGKGRVFISNDRMSILLSALAGIPTIRTTKDPNHTRVLYFYNLSLTNDKEFQQLLNKNMKFAISQSLDQFHAFNQQVDVIYPVLLPHRQFITSLVSRLFKLASSKVTRLGERSQSSRRTEIKYVYEYDCYYKWVVAYYFFAYLLFITNLGASRQFDALVQQLSATFDPRIDENSAETKVVLTSILDVLNKNKFYEALNLSDLTSPDQMMQELLRMFGSANDHESITDSVSQLLTKSYMNVIKGYADANTMIGNVWGKTAAKYTTEVDISGHGTMNAKLACVTPKVATNIANLQNVFKKDIINTIVNNNIPWKFVTDIEQVEVDTNTVIQPSAEASFTRRTRRRQDGGGFGASQVAQRTMAKQGQTAVGLRTRVHDVMSKNPIAHFKANSRIVGTMAPSKILEYDPAPSAQKIVVKNTYYNQARLTDDALIQVIIMFFLQTVPSLTEMIIDNEVNRHLG